MPGKGDSSYTGSTPGSSGRGSGVFGGGVPASGVRRRSTREKPLATASIAA
jgi:hypothetical protein